MRTARENRKGVNIKLLPLLLTSGLFLTQANAAAADLTMALGGFDVSKEATAMGQVEYRFSTACSGFRPQAGLFATADNGVYVYAGIVYPVAMSEKWSLIPGLSGGYYSTVRARILAMMSSSTANCDWSTGFQLVPASVWVSDISPMPVSVIKTRAPRPLA